MIILDILYDHKLSESEKLQKIKEQIKLGADVNCDHYTPLHEASIMGYNNIVEILIENGANINSYCNHITPLYFAIRGGYSSIVELLVKNGAYIDRSILEEAIKVGNKNVVHLSLNNMNIDHSYLLMAVQMGHKDIVKILLNYGADINIQDKDGKGALYYAIEQEDIDIINILIKNNTNTNINIQTNYGWTPLYAALENGYADIAKVLLEHGADPYIETKMGNSSLSMLKNLNILFKEKYN